MALPIVCGFEAQSFADNAEGTGFHATGPPSIETTVIRSGAASMKVDAASEYVEWPHTGTLGQTYRLTIYFRFSGTPTANTMLLDVRRIGAPTRLCQLRMLANTTTLELRDRVGVIGSVSASLTANTWYQLDLVIMVPTSGSGILEAWIDGTKFAGTATADVANTVVSLFCVGNTLANAPAVNFYLDDVRVNSFQTATLGLPSESDSTQTQGASKRLAVSQSTETDLAQAVARRKDQALGQVGETDSALTAAARKAIALGLGLETDAAQPFTALRSAELGQAAETDSLFSLSALKQQVLGQPQETDEALPVTRQGVISAQLGIATEIDEALALIPLAPAQPVSPAFVWTPRRRIRRVTVVPLGIAKETDTALAFDAERNLSELQREEELLALV